uniref:Uncharacterized protein n=1 Tax=Romanomermis culicivorax TaxID=13658 RepID=A0A915KFE2_ROMCU
MAAVGSLFLDDSRQKNDEQGTRVKGTVSNRSGVILIQKSVGNGLSIKIVKPIRSYLLGSK